MKCENCPASYEHYIAAECNEMEWECLCGFDEDDEDVEIDDDEDMVIGCNLTESQVTAIMEHGEEARNMYYEDYCKFLEAELGLKEE